MKWLTMQIRSVFSKPDDPDTENTVILSIDEMEKLRRRITNGSWNFTWKAASARRMVTIRPNIVELTNITRQAIGLIEAGLPVNQEIKASLTLEGGYSVTLKQFLHDSNGMVKPPLELVMKLISVTDNLCNAINTIGKKSPARAEAITGQCTYLLKELREVHKTLLSI